jgi:tetratricopeptide (TPR) repeat protein
MHIHLADETVYQMRPIPVYPVGRPFVFAVLLLILLRVATVAQVNSVVPHLEHAAALIADNHLAEAEKELSYVFQVAPDEPTALNLLGTIRAQQHKFNEAEKLFIRAVRGDNRFVGPHLNLAYLYALTDQPGKTIAELREVLRLDPKNSEALDRLARLLLAQGRIDEGISVIEQAETAQTLSASFLVLLGDAYLKKEDAVRAEGSYRRALEREKDQTDAVLGLAQAAQLRGNSNEALVQLDRARKMVAGSPDTLYRFALVALRAGLFEEANGTLLAAIKLKPDDPSYYLALGTTWIKKPDLAEAEQAFRRALALQPDNPQAQMYLGYTLLEQKKYPEARAYLEKSLAIEKKVPETYYYLGQVAQEENEDERAIQFFKKAIEMAPSYSYAHAELGASYLRLKNYPLAQQELELSVKLNPNDSKAHYSLAVLFARLKNQERSQSEMQIVDKLKNAARTTSGGPSNPSSPNPR